MPLNINIYSGLFLMKSTDERELFLICCCSLAQNHEFNDFLKNTTDCAPSFISLFYFKVSHLEMRFDRKVLCLLVFQEPYMLVLQIDLSQLLG